MITLHYSIAISGSGNALSIVTTYPFSELQMTMRLLDSSGDMLQSERTAPLEDKVQLTKSKPDMASYIEEPDIDDGLYTLEISIPRASLLPTTEFATCVDFNLAIEFVHKNSRPGATPTELANMPFDVLAVRPLQMMDLWKSEERIITVHFDRPVSLDDLSEGRASSH
jgi:hypothetical protein